MVSFSCGRGIVRTGLGNGRAAGCPHDRPQAELVEVCASELRQACGMFLEGLLPGSDMIRLGSSLSVSASACIRLLLCVLIWKSAW